MRILVDVDGVICSFADCYLRVLNHLTGRNHTSTDVTAFDFSQCVATREEDAAVWEWIARAPGLVERLEPIAWNLAAVDTLRRAGHQVIAVTSPQWTSPYWMPERARWLLARGFSKNEIVFASDKSLISGDMLIDDAIHNVQAWQDVHVYGRAVLVSAPWNLAHAWPDRVTTLQELV